MTSPAMVYPDMCWKKASESIGVQEEPIGSNWGRYIRIYLAFVSIFSPAAWCCAFAMFKVNQAAQIMGRSNPFPRTGSCSALASWAKKNGRLLTSPDSTICLFIVRGKDDNGAYVPGLYTHIGFFRPSDDATVEGNSNDDGSAEGYEVVQRTRSAIGPYHYIRLA